MVEDASSVTLACGHKFHGQCAVNLFRRGDPRCPLCRDNPHADDDNVSDDSDMYDNDPFAESPPRVNFHTALQNAMSNRTDKPTQRMKATLRKWKSARRDTRKDMNDKTRIVTVLEDGVIAKITAFEKKLWDTFNKNHKTKVDEAVAAKKAYYNATLQLSNTQARLAKKYGHVLVSRRRRRRRS